MSEPRVSDSTLRTIVNSAPSSGCTVESPTIVATARGCRSGVALPPASPHSRVCPRLRGKSPSSDLKAPPALSLRGRGIEVLVRPPSTGSRREEDFPSLVTQWPTKVNLRMFLWLHHPLCSCLLISSPRTWTGVSLGTHLPRTVALTPSLPADT